MYCQCYICGQQYRIKPPLDNDQVSHGLCEDCFLIEMERFERELAAKKQRTQYVVLPIPK